MEPNETRAWYAQLAEQKTRRAVDTLDVLIASDEAHTEPWYRKIERRNALAQYRRDRGWT